MMYICNLKNNFYLDTSNSAISEITSSVNANFVNYGYNLNLKLYKIANIKFNVNIKDLGITILMLSFHKYYSCGCYQLFVNKFQYIKEISDFMEFIKNMKFSNNFLDLSIQKGYQIKDFLHIFIGSEMITFTSFLDFKFKFYHKRSLEIDEFIEFIKNYHLNIIQSFYIFTSLGSKDSQNRECSMVVRNDFPYTLPIITKTDTFEGDYWFFVPERSIWFAYFENQFRYSNFMTPIIDERIKNMFNFEKLNGPVVGFVYDNKIIPIFIDDIKYFGNWEEIIKILTRNNLPIYLTSIKTCKPRGVVHFVKNGMFNIFKTNCN